MKKTVSRLLVLALAVALAPSSVCANLEAGNAAYQNQDFTAAWAELLPIAKAGNPQAQRLVGNMYLAGTGVAMDAVEAAHWLEMSANQGDVSAMQSLAHLYVQGLGLPQDLRAAANWFQRANPPVPGTGATSPRAPNPVQVAEASVTVNQTPCKQVPPSMPKAAVNGQAVGTVQAGVFLVDGMPKDVVIFSGPRVFHEPVRRAMMQYDCRQSRPTMLATQDFVFKMDAGPPIYAINQREPVFSGQQPAINANWTGLTLQQRRAVQTQYANMAPQDEPPYPQDGMGELLEDLRLTAEYLGVQGGLRLSVGIDANGSVGAVTVLDSPDPAFSRQVTAILSRTRFKAAVCNGQACAMDMPIHASIIKQEAPAPQATFDQLLASAKAGDAKAQNTLGVRFELGQSTAKDMVQAVHWYRQSAEQGLTHGQYNLARMYIYGRGVDRDVAAAASWYRKAADQGHAGAQREFGELLLKGAGVPQNSMEGFQWIQKSAEQGNAWGQFSLGAAYHRGDGVPQNFVEAVKWYQKSADQGHAVGQNNLADAFENGRGVAMDLAQALKWYRLAADQKQPTAIYSLYQLYRDGRGVPRDPVKAVDLLKEAAELGQPKAQFELAQHYADGNGVVKNDTTAIAWFRKAAKNGHKDAMAKLKEMGLEP